MADGKGGVYGSFVMVKFTKGTSKKFDKEGKEKAHITGTTSAKSPVAWVKEPIAKYFGLTEVTAADMLKLAARKVKNTIHGKEVELTTLVSMGATGASRSVTIKFTKLVTIGKKKVASVKMAMPSSHTFSNMVQEIMESKSSGDIAAIVSSDGKSMTFKTPYNKANASRK
jgi:hypothetical protein